MQLPSYVRMHVGLLLKCPQWVGMGVRRSSNKQTFQRWGESECRVSGAKLVILRMTGTPDIDEDRMSNRAPIGIR